MRNLNERLLSHKTETVAASGERRIIGGAFAERVQEINKQFQNKKIITSSFTSLKPTNPIPQNQILFLQF
jgi:hypothetical protein